jgi:hypothetical protein
MSITTPETEKRFQVYSSAVEAKEAARVSLAALNTAMRHGADLEPQVRLELEAAITQVSHLFDVAQEVITRLRPIKIEDRGYYAADRGLLGFSDNYNCGDGKDGCGNCGSGSGGGCGSGGCGGQTP